MKIEEAIIDAQRRSCLRRYAIMSDGHGKTTDQIAAAIPQSSPRKPEEFVQCYDIR